MFENKIKNYKFLVKITEVCVGFIIVLNYL